MFSLIESPQSSGFFLVFCDRCPKKKLDQCFCFGSSDLSVCFQTCAFPGFRCISRVQGTVTVCGKAMGVNSWSGIRTQDLLLCEMSQI